MKEFNLPRKTLILWQFRSLCLGLLLTALSSYFYFKLKPFLILLLIIAVIFIIFTFVYLPLFFKSCKIRCSNEAVILKRGVIFENTHILPFSRLIYTQTVTTPIARLLGLRAITLKAARNLLFVPELSVSDAKAFLAELEVGDSQ